ncbi:MAG TPA: prephenate dehydrogenase/arogenate dehydrogenase family protein [Verrucomicrobiae bacterium]|nr:prephenate dehydrogenase/arogenate dehydrogenase family protein [Verrucomicrobiae bacterium]
MSERVLGIIGTGLIGASIGLRARSEGWFVVGCDADGAAAEEALRRGALDAVVGRDGVIARADVVTIAVPPLATIEELHRLGDLPAVRAELVFDVASVKLPIVQAALGVKNFVASHPMAGRERSGPGAADAGLFEDRSWAYVPSGDEWLDGRLRSFALALGARPFAIDAALHDRTVALTSHLPQLVAFAFVERLQELDADAREGLSGPVARELRRIGASDRELWREIFELNRADLAREARALAARLDRAADALDDRR